MVLDVAVRADGNSACRTTDHALSVGRVHVWAVGGDAETEIFTVGIDVLV
eukprot:CAMPEP_0171688130 /NCGR_PEP_ID=MMETSP0991-20121206/3729_1 /TAXON_ID=483369 /ORGANISM="non described non described, Strain CCMP2098" /LENGTH=49 /DNA_ID=CAMNT_0012276047 /DNA_START=442 /DNA_END=591 /DNA_ORIENTATION=-